jgi:hypothetical protein
MLKHLQKQELLTSQKNSDGSLLTDQIPIIMRGKNKKGTVKLKPLIKEIEKVMLCEALRDNIKVNFINKTEDVTQLNIDGVVIYQILYSLFYNIVCMLKERSQLKAVFLEEHLQLKVILEYSGYGLSKKELTQYSERNTHSNPFLLNWIKLFESLKFHEFICNVEKEQNGGRITLLKYLSSNVCAL